MTPEQKTDFLTLFGKYAYSEIINSRQAEILEVMGVEGPEELATVEGYGEFYKQVSDIASEIETIGALESQEQQTKKAIFLLKEKVKSASNDIVKATGQLITSRLYDKWNQQNQTRYKTGSELILDWIHFFISYTNSSKPSINNTYKSLLKTQFGSTFINSNKERMNLIAALLHKFFKTQKINTFYDKEAIDWSDDFKNKIFSYTAKSFAFVQLIEQDIFYGTSADNYCYKEYASYTDSVAKFSEANQLQEFKPVFFFIISNPSNSEDYKYRPAGLDDVNLSTWADYIKDKQYVTLHTRMTDDELQLKIQEASYKIVAVKKAVFDNFVNAF